MSSNVMEGPESTTSLSIVLAKAESTFLNALGSCLFAPELLEGRALAQKKKQRL